MASAFIITDAPVTERRRVKKAARPTHMYIDPAGVVGQLHKRYPEDMARLAE